MSDVRRAISMRTWRLRPLCRCELRMLVAHAVFASGSQFGHREARTAAAPGAVSTDDSQVANNDMNGCRDDSVFSVVHTIALTWLASDVPLLPFRCERRHHFADDALEGGAVAQRRLSMLRGE